MPAELDRTAPVRHGEELPIDRLESYLRAKLPEAAGALVVEQFPHGHSNLTYLLNLGDKQFVLRRPPFGNQVKTAHDMGREFRVLSRLCEVFAPAPRPYCFCEDESVIGSPFYVMERRHGVILRSIKQAASLEPENAHQLCIALVDSLAQLHALDYRAAGLGDLGKPDGYVTRQVGGWTKRYEQARTDGVPAMDRVARWLAENLPPESGASLIHNDYKHDNLVLDTHDLTRIVAVLDWEMATIGDPLMDLGTTLGYWIEAGDPEPLQRAALGPTAIPGNLTRRQLADRYAKSSGRPIQDILFYYVFGLFKIAVIIQQIYARYVRGHTSDARFAKLNHVVAVMSEQADRSILSGTL